MATVGDFFRNKGAKKVAARLSTKNRLYYYETDNLSLVPPSVYLHDYMSSLKPGLLVKGKLLVNYPRTEWVNNKEGAKFEFDWNDEKDTEFQGAPILVKPTMAHYKQFSLEKLGAPPNLTSIYEETVPYGESKARRIYMLATFCVLKKHGFVYYHKTEGHNIGAILTSKHGDVLAWGVNTGEHRHAEVNTVISYFLRNPGATRLPVDSVLFSTLKPCKMCSSLIKAASDAARTRVWYGMMDEGKSGASKLLGNMASSFTGVDLAELDVFELMSESGTLDTAITAKGTKPVWVPVDGGKVDLYATLNASKKNDPINKSAADWVDDSADMMKLVEAALVKFQGKADKKNRADGAVKKVLAHLQEFVK
ncbi:Bd3614 family nucleic acid deaminase [Massilia sp. TWP1-3-3]|uniref:Bd3614 family nucleic acid deaminase n=1 Tax=Massilia sp. TWP1-3-3 TaxID=2804573 RepID=UPI003CF4F7D7